MTQACALSAKQIARVPQRVDWVGSWDGWDAGELFSEVAPSLYAVDLQAVIPNRDELQPVARVLCIVHRARLTRPSGHGDESIDEIGSEVDDGAEAQSRAC